MKFDFSKCTYGGQLIQSPETEITTPDPEVLLESTYHRFPIHIQNRQTGADYSIKIVDINWWRIGLENPSFDIDGQHGELRGAATMGSREIVINGEIFAATDQGLDVARDTLMEIYRPATLPSLTNRGFRKFLYEDWSGNEWFFYAQVSERLVSFTDEIWQHSIVPFQVRLVTDGDARIFSEDVLTQTIDAGFIAGLNVGINADPLGVQNLGAYQGGSDVNFQSNWFSPTKVTITVEPTATDKRLVNPKIANITTGEVFGVDYTLGASDVLEIDGFSKTISVNGVFLQNIKSDDSFFVNLVKGTNRIIVFDDLHPYIHSDRAIAVLEWRTIKI